MSRWDAARMLGRSRGPGPGAADGNRRLAIRRKPQIVWVFLPPLEPRLLSINSQPQIVFVPGSHLARPQHSPRTALKSQQHVHVVVELPSRHENGNVCRHLLAAKSRHKARDVVSVRSNIPKAARWSALRWISPPN